MDKITEKTTPIAVTDKVNEIIDEISLKGTVSSVNGKTPDSIGNVAITAEDTGARPDSWTPTAAEVGAAAASHTHTPASIGAAASSHTHTAATTSTAGFLSASDKTKLNGIATGANNYVLPVAGTALGGVKNGGNVTINSDGTMTAPEGGGSGGAVESVNGKTGAVTLAAADVGALPEDVTSITTWKYIWDQGLYRSVGDVTDAPDQSGLLDNTDPCYGLVIGDGTNNVEVVFRRNADKEPSVWHRYYMGSGYYTDWYKIAPAEAGADITVTEVDDWNNVTATGFYESYASTPNAPYQSDDDNSAVCGWAIALNSGTQQFAYRNTQGGGPIANALYTRVINPNQRPAYYGDWELVNKQTAADVPITAISGMTATNVQEALEENFQSVVDGKSSLETAITDKGGTVSKAGDVATFAELATGVGTISGGGSSQDAEHFKELVERSSTEITIPESTTKIGSYTFSEFMSLVSISGWDNITEIGYRAFYNCNALAVTSLPQQISKILSYAFYNCYVLALTSLPVGITSIESYVFYNCSALALTQIPNGVKEIKSNAFRGCDGITSLTLPESITSISTNAFASCTNLTQINCQFAQGAVSGAPWGATNANIVYVLV